MSTRGRMLKGGATVIGGCESIGIGAVVAAGAVVTKDVPDFAVVASVPAQVMRYRFPEELREKILASQWWQRSMDELGPHMKWFTQDLEGCAANHPLLQSEQARSSVEGMTSAAAHAEGTK